MRRLRVPDEIANTIRSLHPDLKRKVRRALRDILDDPTIGKLLRDELAGLHSCRVGRFRIVYRAAGSVIEIVAVGPRRTIERCASEPPSPSSRARSLDSPHTHRLQTGP